MTVQARAKVIWLTDNILFSRDGITRTLCNVRSLDKMTKPSLIIGPVLPLVVEITVCGERMTDCN